MAKVQARLKPGFLTFAICKYLKANGQSLDKYKWTMARGKRQSLWNLYEMLVQSESVEDISGQFPHPSFSCSFERFREYVQKNRGKFFHDTHEQRLFTNSQFNNLLYFNVKNVMQLTEYDKTINFEELT